MKTLKISLLFACLAFFISSNINCTEKDQTVEKKESAKNQIVNKNQSQTDTLRTMANNPETEKVYLLFIGSYSNNFYVYKMDSATGALTKVSTSPTTDSPSFLTIHSNKKWIYTVNENSGYVSSFTFDTATFKLSFANTKPSHGSAPCHISIDNTGKYVMVANYSSGTVATFPIATDGSFAAESSYDQHSGTGPHAHMIIQAKNNFVYNTDLGLDKIFVYTLSSDGVLGTTNYNATVTSGAGPRHIAFHPSKPWAYVICELKGLIEAFSVNNSTGELTNFQELQSYNTAGTPQSAEIDITADGKYLYATNRGSINNIAMYSIDQTSGQLTSLGYVSSKGSGPRNFAIDPTGRFFVVGNQNSNNLFIFKIGTDGMLTYTGLSYNLSSPVCFKFMEIRLTKTSTGIQKVHF